VHKYYAYAKDMKAVDRGKPPLVQLMESGALAQQSVCEDNEMWRRISQERLNG
jgi:hypothetical protein